LQHDPEVGDGIRAFIVSSQTGLLQSTKAHHQTLPLNVESLEVKPGDTIDFVVDIDEVLNSDQYLWSCSISTATLHAGNKSKSPTSWNSETDFPRDTLDQLSPIEQLAQVLLCSNEFLFVD